MHHSLEVKFPIDSGFTPVTVCNKCMDDLNIKKQLDKLWDKYLDNIKEEKKG